MTASADTSRPALEMSFAELTASFAALRIVRTNSLAARGLFRTYLAVRGFMVESLEVASAHSAR